MKKSIGPNNSSEKLIQEKLSNGHGSLNYGGIYKLDRNIKVNVLIRRDHLDSQSYAKINLFDGTKWNYLASLNWTESSSRELFYQTTPEEIRDQDIEMIAEDVVALLDLANSILF
jgi:hypothetical protein